MFRDAGYELRVQDINSYPETRNPKPATLFQPAYKFNFLAHTGGYRCAVYSDLFLILDSVKFKLQPGEIHSD